MTVVGEAELDIRAMGTYFSGDIQRVVQPGMARVGTGLEQTAAQGRRAFGVMWSTFQQSADGALGPVSQMVDHVQSVADELHHGSLALRTAAVGAAGVGIATGIQMFGAQEQQARAQLEASLENTGHVWEEYSGQIDGAINAGHRMAVHNYETMDALNRLVLATRNPERAIKDYNVVLAIAAARHMSVTSAAAMLASVYGGNTRMFRMFGMNIAAGNKELAAAQSATKSHSEAVTKLKTARQALADTEAKINASRQGHAATAAQVASAEASVASARAAVASANFQHGTASPQAAAAAARLTAAQDRLTEVTSKGTSATKLTVTQQIELRKAHEKVAEAQKNVTKTTADMTAAHKAAAGATTDVQKHVDDLSQRLSGQYTAAVHNFRTELHAFGVDLEDAFGSIGAKYGPGLTALSTGVLAAGTLAQGGMAIFSRFSASGRATVAMNQVFAETTAAEVEATNASTEASLAMLQSQALTAETEIALAGETAATETAAAWTTADTEISAGLATVSASADAEFAGMAVAGESAAVASTASWTGAMGKAGLALSAFTASYMATTELLKHTPLGHPVKAAADSIANWLGVGPKQAYEHEINKLTTPQLQAAEGTGKYAGYVFGPAGYFTPDGKFHKWSNAPKSLNAEAQKWTGLPAGWHAPMALPGSPPPNWHAPELLPGQKNAGQHHGGHHPGHGGSQEIFGEMRGLRMDVLRIVRAAEKQVTALENLPHGLSNGQNPKFSSPSLATLG
jgi:hypothetical protein